jgi:hypothetical protein
MAAAQRPPAFRGRSSERQALDRLLADARAGRSGVLVIRGDSGIGKTALMRYTADRASGFRVAQVSGVESERELPFAGLHQLCAPLLDHLDALPAPQQNALRVALGVVSGAAPDRFLVGLATLSLLAEVAEEQPLLCLVDDLQWLDGASVQALGFVARRLLAERVAILLALREPSEDSALAGLPEVRLEGLGHDDASALLSTAVPGRLDRRVRGDRRESAGPPRASARHWRRRAGGRLRPPRSGDAVGDRGRVPPSVGCPTRRHTASARARSRRPCRRPLARVACGRATRGRA